MVVWGLGLGLGLVHISYIITFCQSCILQLGNARVAFSKVQRITINMCVKMTLSDFKVFLSYLKY